MREIKFRAWNGKSMILQEHSLWHLLGEIMRFRDLGAELIPGYVLMQYTGLKDKNGKEIYEGDIVKWFHGSEDIGIVEYMCLEEQTFGWMEMAYFGIHLRDSNEITTFQYDDEYEVVGNIYENPELLKQS